MQSKKRFSSADKGRICAFYLKWINDFFSLEDMNTSKDQIVAHLRKKQEKKILHRRRKKNHPQKKQKSKEKKCLLVSH